MRQLVYTATGIPVKIGDRVILRDGDTGYVTQIIEPYKPESTGRVEFCDTMDEVGHGMLYFPSVIGAEWRDVYIYGVGESPGTGGTPEKEQGQNSQGEPGIPETQEN